MGGRVMVYGGANQEKKKSREPINQTEEKESYIAIRF